LISTFAPTSSNFFLIAAASSLVTPSLIGLGRAFDQVLRFLQPEAGDFANDLDDVDLVRADFRQGRGELGLLLDRRLVAACRPPPPPGIAIGIAAAADTPSSDSRALTSCESSSTEIPLM
jgi:hypothetical protein